MARASQVNDTPHMRLSEYAAAAVGTNQLNAGEARDQLRFGLFGEVGGLLALVKKSHRELETADHNAITEEIGDSLWYLTNVAAKYDTSLQVAGVEAMHELQTRLGVTKSDVGEVTFEEFDGLLQYARRQLDEMDTLAHLRQLATHAGQLLESPPATTDLLSKPPQELLGKLLADLAMVAALFKQKLGEIAASNLVKVRSRWPGPNPVYRPLFDEGFSELEQFPRDEFDMEFIQIMPSAGASPYVIQRLRGINIGDRLTDNRADPDGYRFHDVFHLAYMTHLGWSPVIRSLLKLKRKSRRDLDENQDGARAGIIEEAISTWVFNHAHMRNFFESKSQGRLSYDLLKQVHDMVRGYEVHDCPLWQWEKAILDGFSVFRDLVANNGGIVRVNLQARTIKFIESIPILMPAPPVPDAPPLVGSLPPPGV
jgi:NTP pyrophosphatase (non-canonical NTP hydrolase)